MIGISNLPLRRGGYIIPIETQDSTNKIITVNVPDGCRIMCTNCTLENQSTLVSNGSVLATTDGFFIKKSINNLKIIRTISNLSPLSIIKGHEILYCDHVITDSGMKFNVPKGFRINGTICQNTGEITVPEKNNYLIEF